MENLVKELIALVARLVAKVKQQKERIKELELNSVNLTPEEKQDIEKLLIETKQILEEA